MVPTALFTVGTTGGEGTIGGIPTRELPWGRQGVGGAQPTTTERYRSGQCEAVVSRESSSGSQSGLTYCGEFYTSGEYWANLNRPVFLPVRQTAVLTERPDRSIPYAVFLLTWTNIECRPLRVNIRRPYLS